VLCEKPFTINANEAKVLFGMAKEKNLFVMEAMWTRFLPVTQYISDLVKGGTLGDVKVVYVHSFRFLFDRMLILCSHADLSRDFDLNSMRIYLKRGTR
jgi:predicted dehydrogenase